MSRVTGAGLLAIGATIVTSAVTGWVGYWIYSLGADDVELWGPASWACVGLALLGAIVLGFGAARRESGTASMRQRSGRSSINIQSGRDTRLDRD